MKSKIIVFIVILFAGCLTQFAADIYAPSIPAISIHFGAHVDLAQWSMAIYLLGAALSQLIYGPLSEGLGRKIPLLIGLAIMLVGSIICLIATNIDALIWGRFVQGLGAGAAATLWRSIFRDVYSGEELAKYGSYMVIFVMFIIPAAPALGGILQDYFGWRSNFIFMSVYTLLALLLVFARYKETSRHHHLERLKAKYITKTYLHMLSSPIFMGITFCTFLTYGAFFSWFVVGPVLLIERIGLDPMTFGLITLFGGAPAYAGAAWINGRLVKSLGIPFMLRLGWIVAIFAACLMLLGSVIFGMNAWAIVIPALLFYFGSTFIWPNAFALAFTPFGHIAGYAAALYGFMQLGGGSALGGIISYLPSDTQIPLGFVMLLASLAAWLIYECVESKEKQAKML